MVKPEGNLKAKEVIYDVFEIGEQEWRGILNDDEFRICRQKGTEQAFSGEYWDCKDSGIYHCRACGQSLFDADTKYDTRIP